MSTSINVYVSRDADMRPKFEKLILELIGCGFEPFVDGVNEARFSMENLFGFTFSFAEQKFFRDHPDGVRVDALITFNPALTEHELELAMTYFAPIFGLKDTQKKIITRSTSRLFEQGYLKF